MSNSKSRTTIAGIMKAATRHFSMYGFKGARMDAIAREAGVNKATIYYHLGNKKALYSEVLHAVFGERADALSRRAAEAPTGEAKLKVIFRGLSQLIKEKPHISAILMHEVASGGRNFPEVLVKDFAHLIGMTADALNSGRRTRELRSAHPMVVYLAAIAPMVYYEKIHSGLHDPLQKISRKKGIPVISFDEFSRQVETLILEAIQKHR